MSTFENPTSDQVAQTRTTLWHQAGNPLLTVESLRAWLNQAGLVLYTPRPQQLPLPAPSFVEAVLGARNPAPTLAETAEARTLLTRLVTEGSAVPLNLLGTPTGAPSDTPDFICSSAVFAYIFTLRGDKAWKQPPATSGPIKVSPLALAAYEALTAGGAQSAAALATELGKEVNESAVLRALSELWTHLRVLPVLQTDAPTLWEPMAARFTKAMKAGGNAGQPSALSALISLYLGMAILATEEEIETILSPLAPRSRIRDVVHALMGASQLETLAIDGRTVLHISGDLPVFAAKSKEPAVEAAAGIEPAEGTTVRGSEGAEAESGQIEVETLHAGRSSEAAEGSDTSAPTGRITKFVPRPRKIGTGFVRKFSPGPATATGADDRARRPFVRKPFATRDVEGFAKPWNEARPAPPPLIPPSLQASGEDDATAPPARSRPFRPDAARGTRPGFAPRTGPSRPESARPGPAHTEGGTRPTFRSDPDSSKAGSDRRPRPFTTRPAEGISDAPRKTFSKPGTFGRKRDFATGKPGFDPGSRPPRRDFNAAASGDFPERPKRLFAPNEGAPRRPGSYSPRPPGSPGGFAGKKPWKPREDGPARPYTPREGREDRPARDSGTEAPRKVFRKFDAPRSPRPGGRTGPGPDGGKFAPGRSDRKPFTPRDDASGQSAEGRPPRTFSKPGSFSKSGSFSKPGSGRAGGFSKSAPGGKKPFTRSGPKPPGTFAKFADGTKPFRKPGPGGKKFASKPGGKSFDRPPAPRKPKTEEGDNA